MDHPLRIIRVLSDGRAGHENQSVGLAEALCRRTGASVELVPLQQQGGFIGRLRAAALRAPTGEEPDLLIGTGHRTHLALLWAGRAFECPTVVIMKPTLPSKFFDLCLMPRHDLNGAANDDNIVPVFGALNRLPETPALKERRGLVLIGGPSSHHGWAGPELNAAIATVIAARPELNWTVADSRRTPAGTLEGMASLVPQAERMPHQNTAPAWLPGQLMRAEEVWVTEDSISMLHEAATAGARTGVLPMPRLKSRGRVLRAVEELTAAGHARCFEDWQRSDQTLPPPKPLHETSRCADLVLQRFYPAQIHQPKAGAAS